MGPIGHSPSVYIPSARPRLASAGPGFSLPVYLEAPGPAPGSTADGRSGRRAACHLTSLRQGIARSCPLRVPSVSVPGRLDALPSAPWMPLPPSLPPCLLASTPRVPRLARARAMSARTGMVDCPGRTSYVSTAAACWSCPGQPRAARIGSGKRGRMGERGPSFTVRRERTAPCRTLWNSARQLPLRISQVNSITDFFES
jgi:hypothetical protein